jgi:hypothetical protein
MGNPIIYCIIQSLKNTGDFKAVLLSFSGTLTPKTLKVSLGYAEYLY